MRRIMGVAAFLSLLMLLTSARDDIDFLRQGGPSFGMSQADLNSALANEKDWEIAYRIRTTQTEEIACTWRDKVLYRLSFYQGACYGIEKSAEVPREEVDRVFAYFGERLGQTH